ncbi:MAG: DNA internalization-related competence protein ComEC/Rec2 [Desulfatiglandales bacterium]
MADRPLIPLLFAFVGGIVMGHFGLSPGSWLGLFLMSAAALFLILFLSLPPRLKFSCFLGLFFLAGLVLDISSGRDSELCSLADRRERVTIEGTVLGPARIFRETARFEVRGEKVIYHDRSRSINERLIVTVYNHAQSFFPGDRILFPARLRAFKNFENPGGYDYESAMRFKGLACGASVSDGRSIVPLGKGALGFPMGVVEKARGPLRRLFREGLDDRNRAIYSALILGERQDIDPDLREAFTASGLGHILAVSGLHIGLIAWLSFGVSKWVFSRSYHLVLKTDIRKLAALVTCFPVVGYTGLAGFQVSSQRAMIMVLTYLFSVLIGREKEKWSTLALAALLVLALDPYELFGISFQLSFCAVIGILWLTPILYNKFPKNRFLEERCPHFIQRCLVYMKGLVAVTGTTMFFLLPITAFYFQRISLVSIPANLMAAPLLGLWVIPMGLLSALFLPVSVSAADLFLQAGAWGLKWIETVIAYWSRLPWAEVWVVTPSILEIGLFYGLLYALILGRTYRWARAGLVILSCVTLVDIGYWVYQTQFNPNLKVTFLDVGQGNAALVQFPGNQRMLIDGGGFSRDHFDVGKMVLAPYLLRSKIRRIDYLVLSHPQSDHMNGFRFVAAHFHSREFWYNGDEVDTRSFIELMHILQNRKIDKILPQSLREGRDIAGVRIELLHPLGGGAEDVDLNASMDLNERSLVLKISYKGKSILFPGDIERLAEGTLTSRYGYALQSDVLLAPHHGSKTSCSRPFLEKVSPSLCVISSGRGNRFGFPHAGTIKRLTDMGCAVIRTDQNGAIRVSVGEEGLTVTPLGRNR